MKSLCHVFSWGLFLIPALLAAQVRETPGSLSQVDGANPQGYFQGSNNEGILFSASSGGQAQLIPYSKINGEGLGKQIRFSDKNDLMTPPRNLYAKEDYAAAAAAFGKVAQDYAFIQGIPMNFATEALFYQLESLKRAGQYGALAPLVNTPQAETINTKLPEAYRRPLAFLKLWALFGANDMPKLKEALAIYQETATGSEKLLKAPNFVPMPSNEISQIAFLRAKVFESEGEKSKALDDYYRAFTVAFGNDVLLSKLAMGGAMQIQISDPKVAEDNKVAVDQLKGLAYMYARRFGKDSMPESFQKYAVKPDVQLPEVSEGTSAEPAVTADGAKAEEKKSEAKDAPAKEDGKASTPDAKEKKK